ncbi:glycoside hydrolase family 172 protein [Haloferula sargassicola]|uniref:DUF2961 domain-containing protein n=1 Tax=Haloferula sargassicola TaxID=490096 RepID=A0ABP9UMM6_9BACT
MSASTSRLLSFLLVLPAAAAPIDTGRLLREMTDYDAVARWPGPAYHCLQASSHDRRTTAPGEPGWFANDDHTQYLREERKHGRAEKVMLDEDGPGAMVRFWLTTVENKSGTLRVYLDHSDEPTLEFPAFDLMSGSLELDRTLLLPHPGYAREGNGGNTLMLPVPFARHCKVTWEEKGSGPRYYQINVRRYAPGTEVRTFTRSDLVTFRDALNETATRLASPPEPPRTGTARLEGPLVPKITKTLDLPPGPAAVSCIRAKIPVSEDAGTTRLLRSLIVKLDFDDETTAWCPLGDFFGSGAGLNSLQSWYRTIDADGTLTCRWVMPYRRSGSISIENLGDLPAEVSLEASTKPWSWDADSMHFHTAWHSEHDLDTPPVRDWNFARLRGRGVYVGDTLSLFNRIATWYGEGDEKILVDADPALRHLGTGTEDYYNYSFAPRGIMQTPFANQIRVDQPATQGHNVLTRTRHLDAIPFERSLDFDIELMSWKRTRLNYAATTYWYGFPGITANVTPEPDEALAPVPTLEEAMNPPAFEGVSDAELLRIVDQSDGLVTEVQDMSPFGFDSWSRGAQLLVKASKKGDFVTMDLPAPNAGNHRIWVAATQAVDYGNLRFTINGSPSRAIHRGFAPEVRAAEPLDLGVFKPVDGRYRITAEVSGTSASSEGARFYFGLDSFRMEKP